MMAAMAARKQVSFAGVGFPSCQERSQVLNYGNRAGLEFALGVVFAEVDCRSNIALRGVDIDDFQGTSFRHAASGVETNPEERAVAMSLQTLVKQQFDFRLGEDFRLPVTFNLHAWCIPDLTLQSLAYLLHCCIGLGYFLMLRFRSRQVRRGRSHSGLLICLVKDASAAVDRNKYVFAPLSSGQHLVRRYVIVRGRAY